MGFRMRLDLHIPDQDCPNALSAEQQDVIDRFRRDVIGAQSATVSVMPDDNASEEALGYEKIFHSGSVNRPDNVSANVETVDATADKP